MLESPTRGRDVGDAAERLIAVANERGGHDNITVIVACVGQRTIPVLPEASPEQRVPAASRTFDPDVDALIVPPTAAAPESPRPAVAAPAPTAPRPESPADPPLALTRPMAAVLMLITFAIGCLVGWEARDQLPPPDHVGHPR